MMRWFRRKDTPDPIFEHIPTPGQALDAAMTEQRQAHDGATDEMLSDLRALYDALAVKCATLEGRVQALEAWKKQIEGT